MGVTPIISSICLRAFRQDIFSHLCERNRKSMLGHLAQTCKAICNITAEDRHKIVIEVIRLSFVLEEPT